MTRRCLRRPSFMARSRRCSWWSRSRSRCWRSPRSSASSWPPFRPRRRSRIPTLSHLPRLLAVAAALAILGPWMGHEVAAFAAQMFAQTAAQGSPMSQSSAGARRAPAKPRRAPERGAPPAPPGRRQARADPRRGGPRFRQEGIPRDARQRGRQGGRRRGRDDLPLLRVEGPPPRVALRAPGRAAPRLPRDGASARARARRIGSSASSSCSSVSSRASATSPRSSPSSFASRRS